MMHALCIKEPILHKIFSQKKCVLIQGWLHIYGQLDFAGGTVVHISSGVSGLTAALILGKRHDYGQFRLISFFLLNLSYLLFE